MGGLTSHSGADASASSAAVRDFGSSGFDAARQDVLAAAFSIIETTPDMEATVAALRDLLQVDHLVYHSSKLGMSPARDPYVRLTYPAAWIKRYLQMGYVDVDPVLREGFLRSLPFEWTELSLQNEAERAFFMDALEHGVGTRGLSIPVVSKSGHRGLFSLSFSGSDDDWERIRRKELSALVQIANRVHHRVLTEVFGEQQPRLTSRELECLRWVALGKEATDIAKLLGISPHTARDYLKSARFKLDCVTSAQAVSKAVKMGFLTV